MTHKIDYIIGVDEAGRGPLAGPLSVAAVVVPSAEHVTDISAEITDSKQLSEKKREDIYEQLTASGLAVAHTFILPATIDHYGMAYALRRAVSRTLDKLAIDPARSSVRLDGALAAPPRYQYQQTIVHGDLLEPIIGAASIVAKVRRDRAMIRYGEQFPEYGFAQNKGYGTITHRAAILEHGPCAIHRHLFLRSLLAS